MKSTFAFSFHVIQPFDGAMLCDESEIDKRKVSIFFLFFKRRQIMYGP